MAVGRLTLSSILLVALVACAQPPSNDAGQAAAANEPAKPEVVCQHVRELASQDGSEGEALDAVQRECVLTLTAMRTRYETFTSCVDAATSPASLRACESDLAKQPSLLGASSPEAAVEAICDHVMKLLTAEIAQLGTEPGQTEQLRTRCLTDAGASRESIGAEKFDAQAKCILAATNLETLQGCGGF